MRHILSILLVVFISGVFVPHLSLSQEKADEGEGIKQNQEMKKERAIRHPVLSFSLSLVVPGAGQIYNGQVYKGLGFFYATAAFSGITYLGWSLENGKGAIASPGQYPDRTFKPLIATGAIIGGLIYNYQLIEAPIMAKKINEKKGYRYPKGFFALNFTGNGFGLQYRF